MTKRSMDATVSPAVLLDAFVETSDDAMVSHDAGGNVTTWSQTAERLFGYHAEEILGEPYASLFPDHVRDDVRAVIDTVMAGDRVKHFETEILRKDGMPVPISMSLCPVHDDDGVPVASVLIARDITEQRLAQATLAEVEARVARARRWPTSAAGCGTCGQERCSGATSSIASTASTHSTSTERSSRASPPSTPTTRTAFVPGSNLRSATGRPFEDEYRVVRPDDEIRSVHAHAPANRRFAGDVLGLRGIGQDVTDQRTTERNESAAE